MSRYQSTNLILSFWLVFYYTKKKDEVYILGNPPYLGSSMQNKEQKDELSLVFNGFKNYKNLDYISCWFKKASDFTLKSTSSFAFVSTNSICQGEQVALLWPYIFKNRQEINFAHQSFTWNNNAKNKAAVIVIIVGISNIKNGKKYLFHDTTKKTVKNINSYLIEGSNIFLERKSSPISDLPSMIRGSTFTDDGNLSLTNQEKDELIEKEPKSEKFISKLIGSVEFIRGESRWCLLINDKDITEAQSISMINQRLEKVRNFRLKSKAPSTVEFAKLPHKYKQYQHKSLNGIIVPRVSSIRRKYIPAGYISKSDVILDSAQVI